MPQYSFSSKESLINQVDEIAGRESRSRSDMIVLLLTQAIKERERQRNKKRAKESNTEHNPADTRSSDDGGQGSIQDS